MAATKDCGACSKLRNNSDDFVVNGVTKNVCTYLKNNKGFGGSSNDCTDLDRANDCLIGNMEDEINAYQACDWKAYMAKFIHNLWNMLRAIICAICGLWTKTEKNECMINHLFEGAELEIGEDSTDGSYVRAGGGVSYLFDQKNDGDRISDVKALYIAGGLLRIQGTFKFFKVDFTDKDGKERQGNSHWRQDRA